ncbi:MAG: hypothetical protein JNJ52_03140 [Flavobacterium sp.]|nr:hypothetical protein [Flavobacterium sp.]
MQIKFNIVETIETEIYYGSYAIYILGGHYVKVNPDFHIKITNIDTNKDIELTENILKAKVFKYGRRAVKFYSFENMEYGKFKISVLNYNDMVVKDSQLEIFPLPFKIPLIINHFILGKSRKDKDINTIEILIA